MRLADELRGIRGVRPDTRTGQLVLQAATRCFESLIGQLQRELEDEGSRLRQDLSAAGVEVDFLRRQLDAVTDTAREANRVRRPGLIAGALIGLGSLLGSIVTGAAEGVSSVVTQTAVDERGIEDFAAECVALANEVLDGRVVDRDRSGPLPTTHPPESGTNVEHDTGSTVEHERIAAAGWYPDPAGGDGEPVRWWTGDAWAAEVRVSDLNGGFDRYKPQSVPWPPPRPDSLEEGLTDATDQRIVGEEEQARVTRRI
jgi:hypothetical protein